MRQGSGGAIEAPQAARASSAAAAAGAGRDSSFTRAGVQRQRERESTAPAARGKCRAGVRGGRGRRAAGGN